MLYHSNKISHSIAFPITFRVVKRTARSWSYCSKLHFYESFIGDHSSKSSLIYKRKLGMSTHLMKNQNISSTAVEEIILKCSDGMKLAAKRWGYDDLDKDKKSTPKVLCLHGWLDNASSYNLIAPDIANKLNAEVIALDFPGHGRSSHKNIDGPTQLLSEYALYVAEALSYLKWTDANNQNNKVILIGHSMGAGVSVIFAAAYPEYVEKLVLLEGLGPLARKSNVSQHIRQAIDKRITSNKILYPSFSSIGHNTPEQNVNNVFGGKRKYPSIDIAIKTRIMAAKSSPGNQYISKEAATALVCRSTVRADEGQDPQQAGGKDMDPSYEGPVYFRHDSRLMWPSLHYFSQDQVNTLLGDIKCPTCVLIANDGWPFDTQEMEKGLGVLKPTVLRNLPGSHHFHADPDTALAVSNEVTDFLVKAV